MHEERLLHVPALGRWALPSEGVMGRPNKVTDSEIVEAGKRLQARLPPGGTVVSNALWREVGRRGRASRLMSVWRDHLSSSGGGIGAASGEVQRVETDVIHKGASSADALGLLLRQMVGMIRVSIQEDVEALQSGQAKVHAAAQAESLRASEDLGAKLADVIARVAQLEEELADARGNAVTDAMTAQREAEARIAELEHDLALSRERESAAVQQADEAAVIVTELRRELADSREEVAVVNGRLRVQEGKVQDLLGNLTQERGVRDELETWLSSGMRLLTGRASAEDVRFGRMLDAWPDEGQPGEYAVQEGEAVPIPATMLGGTVVRMQVAS